MIYSTPFTWIDLGEFKLIFPNKVVIDNVEYTFDNWKDLSLGDPQKNSFERTVNVTGDTEINAFAVYKLSTVTSDVSLLVIFAVLGALMLVFWGGST